MGLNFKQIVLIVVSKQMLDVAWDFLREKLAKEPTLLLMIVGIPNVGKSALINTLFRHAHALTKAGATLNIFLKKKHGWIFTCVNGIINPLVPRVL